jgi:hypothetical protein
MQMILRLVLAGVIVSAAAQSLTAQNTALRVCVTQTTTFDAPTGEAPRLADAISQQKLRSGRPITAISVPAESDKGFASQIQTNGCDYLVQLKPWVNSQGGMNAANDAVGSPSAAVPVYHSGLDYPVLKYELFKIGQKHSIARGEAIYQRTAPPGKAR